MYTPLSPVIRVFTCSIQQQSIADRMLQGSADHIPRGRARRLKTGIPGPLSPFPRSRRLDYSRSWPWIVAALTPVDPPLRKSRTTSIDPLTRGHRPVCFQRSNSTLRSSQFLNPLAVSGGDNNTLLKRRDRNPLWVT